MAEARTRRRPEHRLGFGLVRGIYIALFLLFVLAPLYWVVITSIKPTSDYLAIPPVWFPAEPTIVHYTAALFAYRGLAGLINSLVVASATTVLSAAFGTLMGYSLARFNTGGPHLSFWVLSQRFLPPIAIVLPVFLLYRGWGLYDTRIGLVLIYTMITLPLAVPGIVVAAVFAFIFVWTEFFFALNLTSRSAFTLPTIFRAFLGFQASQYGEASALAVTSLVPSIILGMLVQHHLVRGLTLGAVQG